MYFPGDKSYELIHSSWVKPYIKRKDKDNNKGVNCYFPSGISEKNFKIALENKYQPQQKWSDKWGVYKVNIERTISKSFSKQF